MTSIQCHYDILGVERDADNATIKKSHRKLALKLHPDKNIGDEDAAEKFRLVQQAYEVLSDPQERKWYDDHREAILAGWSTNNSPDESVSMIFDVVHYMHPGCYSGYHSNKGGFYQVFRQVFEEIVACERKQSESLVELPTDFGDADADWATVQDFYQSWESFSSALNFAWEDKYNVHEDAPNRRVRRLMEDDNKKQRKAAKKEYNNDILQLVAFVKRRDPRVKAKKEEQEREKREKTAKQKQEQDERKREQQKAKEAWRENQQREMEQAEEQDRLAGRIRLADLEDDYDYGGGKKKKGKKRKNKRVEVSDDEEEDGDGFDTANKEVGLKGDDDAIDNANGENREASGLDVTEDDDEGNAMQAVPNDADDMYVSSSEEEEEEEDEPDVWRCECCRKDFKSEGQMENHMKSKKHKEAFKKYQAKLKKKEEEILADMMNDLEP